MKLNWLREEYGDNWPDSVVKLYREFYASPSAKVGESNPVFGKDDTWYFFDETWSDALGPFKTQKEANEACQLYAVNL